MNWPLGKDWVCETCSGQHGLTWGQVHAQCRCNLCHTQYTMRDSDEERTILTTPRCMIKDEYKEPVKQAWQKLSIPVDELTEEQLEPYLDTSKVF